MNKAKREQLAPLNIDAIDSRFKGALRKAFRNRAFLYAFGILLIAGALVFSGVGVTGTPEFANASAPSVSQTTVQVAPSFTINDTISPKSVRSSIQGMSATQAVHFLTFDRWNGSNTLPAPNVGILNIGAMISGGITMIGSFLFAIASVVMWLMGVLLAMALNLDLLNRLALTIDHAFAMITNNVMAGSAAFGLIIAKAGATCA